MQYQYRIVPEVGSVLAATSYGPFDTYTECFKGVVTDKTPGNLIISLNNVRTSRKIRN